MRPGAFPTAKPMSAFFGRRQSAGGSRLHACTAGRWLPSARIRRRRRPRSRRERGHADRNVDAELDIGLDPAATVLDADRIASAVENELRAHIPAFLSARIRVKPHRLEAATSQIHKRQDGHVHGNAGHHHAPAPVQMQSRLAQGLLEIIETPAVVSECGSQSCRLTISSEPRWPSDGMAGSRKSCHSVETGPPMKATSLPLNRMNSLPSFVSISRGETETLAFAMSEPSGQAHRHS